MVVFYTYDELLVSQNLEWLQEALNFLIRLFWYIGLASNIAKSKTITCQQGEIRSEMLEEVLVWCSRGKGETYREKQRKNVVPALQIGDDGGLHDISFLTYKQNRVGDRLGKAPGDPTLAPPQSI